MRKHTNKLIALAIFAVLSGIAGKLWSARKANLTEA